MPLLVRSSHAFYASGHRSFCHPQLRPFLKISWKLLRRKGSSGITSRKQATIEGPVSCRAPTMEFVDPRTDYAFKKIFGSAESKGILIAFLNALVYNGEEAIADLEILDPYLAAEVSGLKDSYLDVRATLQDGTFVIIEMQVVYAPFFQKRILYNTAKSYANQLPRGKGYRELNPVIALTITNFTMFSQVDRPIVRFHLREDEAGFAYPYNELRLVFVELPKFRKKETELETLADRWIYFLKKAGTMTTIPGSLQGIPELNRALDIARRANFNPKELDAIERREMYLIDQQSLVADVRTQGKREQALETAQRLLDLLDNEAIARSTGLTVLEVAALRER